jgi:REP element-mobilizing transposase RayT
MAAWRQAWFRGQAPPAIWNSNATAESDPTNYERKLLNLSPVKLTKDRRKAIERGIREACEVLKWRLWAFNIRTNHVHVVVSANCNSRRVRSTLKSNATRSMREAGCWQSPRSPWAAKGSRRFLWTEEQLIEAIDYVLYSQGEELK